MNALAELISAIASLAWPAIAAVLLFTLYRPLRSLVESARGRKFTIKVAGNELSMEEASEQQRVILSDLQGKVAELERFASGDSTGRVSRIESRNGAPVSSEKRVLWVDDQPRNNSYLVAALEERGGRVDTALNTDEALAMFKQRPYDIVISDMQRPEGDQAGIDLIRRIKSLKPSTPIYIFCGAWAARNLRGEALRAGATEITSSGTTLLSALGTTVEP